LTWVGSRRIAFAAPQPLDEILAIGIPPKNLAPLNTSANHVVHATRCIDAASAVSVTFFL
jgi:hypothetical protein